MPDDSTRIASMARKRTPRGKIKLGSTIAAAALGALMTGVGASGSPAEASIAPEERAGALKSYRIPKTALMSALNTLADQNGLHLSYDAQMTRGMKTRGLSGKYTVKEALRTVLDGTGLTYRLSPKGDAVSIVLAQAATDTQSDAPPVALPTIDVEGSGDDAGTGYSAPPVLQSTTKIAVPTFNLPVAIQTVPRQVIEDQNAIKIQDALQNVSGVRSNSNNAEGNVFNIRGFESFDIFRNGLKIGGGLIAPSYDTANIQNLEVLKGPASFVFGRSEPGGIVNMVTKRPLDSAYNSITQQFGSFNLYRTAWDLTGPALPDGALTYRFSGAYTNGGQYVDFINYENVFLAPAVTWNIDPATTFTVDAQYVHQNAQGFTGIPAVGYYPADLPVYRSFSEPNNPPDRIRSALISYEFKRRLDENWTLTNRFLALRETFEAPTFFSLASAFQNPPILDRSILYQKGTTTNFSTNLDLTGSFNVLGVRNDVLVGADYFYFYRNYISSINGNYPINIYNPVYGTVPTSAFYDAPFLAWTGEARRTLFWAHSEKDLGIYAQDSITPFEGLHILVGARYDLADVRNGYSVGVRGVTAPATFAAAYEDFGTSSGDHNQALSPRVGVNYQPLPWLSFYGSYTKSFGAPNGFSPNNSNFAPQIAVGWEGGVKTQLMDDRLTATLAFYDITKSNILTTVATPDGFSEQRPIGIVRSQGAELDVLGKLTDELSIIASYSHIDARVVADNDGLLGKSLKSYAPDSGSVFLAYQFRPDTIFQGLRVGGGIYAVSNRWGDDPNTFILPAYARLDAFAKYQFTSLSAKWSAQVNVTNITDEKYYYGNDVTLISFRRFGVFPGAPRAVTASLRVEF